MLAPFAGQLLVAGEHSFFPGSADRWPGIATAVAGDPDGGLRLLSSGLAFEETLGSVPLQARTLYWTAWVCLRDECQEPDAASAALTRSRDMAAGCGMDFLAGEAASLLTSLAGEVG